MPGEQFSSSRIYLNVNQGALRQTVTEDVYGAKKRTYTKKDGSVKTVWEIVYKNWTGKIQRISVKDTEYGKQMEVDFVKEVINKVPTDVRVTIPVDSQYFGSFVKRIMGADLNSILTINPYDFEPEPGKRKVGFTIVQNGQKLTDYFYDEVSQKNIHGFPEVNEAEKKNEGYWKNYFGYTVKNFLLAKLATLTFGNEIQEDENNIEEYLKVNPVDEMSKDIPTIGETSMVDEAEIDEIRIEDVPF